jgi:hypothetical protein
MRHLAGFIKLSGARGAVVHWSARSGELFFPPATF